MLSKRIAYLRKKSEMSQAQLAEHLNISPSTIGMYEQGRRVPDLDVLLSLSRLFGVSLDYLITGEESTQHSSEELKFLLRRDILAKNAQEVTMLITDQTAIGTRLREIRKSKKLSQAEVAVAAGISVKAYADIERGNVNMRVGTMLSICQALHILPNDLFADEVDDINADYQELLLRLNSNSDEDNELVQNILHVIIAHLKNTAENTIR